MLMEGKGATSKKNNTIWYALGSSSFAIDTFIMTVLVGQILDIEAIGEFSIALAISQLLYILGIFGINNYQMTDYREEFSFDKYLTAKYASLLLMFVALAGVCILGGLTASKVYCTILMTIHMAVHALADVFQNYAFAQQQLEFVGKSIVYRVFLSLVVFALLLLLLRDLRSALIGKICASVMVTVFYTIWPYRKKMRTVKWSETLGLLRVCLPLAISAFLMNYILNSPKYAIEQYANDTVQGYYSLVFMPAMIINLFSQFIYRIYFKRFDSYIAEKKSKELYSVLRKILLLILVTLICGGILIYFAGVPIMKYIFAVDLSIYVSEMLLMLAGGALLTLNYLLYFLLVILRKQKLLLFIYAGCALAAFFLNSVFVSQFALSGAMVSFILAYGMLVCSLLVAFIHSMRKRGQITPS